MAGNWLSRLVQITRDLGWQSVPLLVLLIASGLLSILIPVTETLWSEQLFVSGSINTWDRPAGCTYTLGYWKNHPTVWPDQSLVLGDVSYSQDELLGLLDMPAGGDASIILAQQLIAAKLNIANGVDGTEIAATLAASDDWLIINSTSDEDGDGRLPYDLACNTPAGQEAVALAELLDMFNNGDLWPGHCVDEVVARAPAPVCPFETPCLEEPFAGDEQVAEPTASPTPEPSEEAPLLPPAAPLLEPSLTPELKEEAVREPSATPASTDTPLPTLTDTPLPTLTDTPLPEPTDTPLPEPTDTPLPEPTPTPTETPVPISAILGVEGTAEGFWSIEPEALVPGVRGEICVANQGEYPTENLAITGAVLAQIPGGPYRDHAPLPLEVGAWPELDPGESHCYPFEITFEFLEGAQYLNVASTTITNHTDWLPGSDNCPGEEACPYGPEIEFAFQLPDRTAPSP